MHEAEPQAATSLPSAEPDESYGYTARNPILVGGGPSGERRFLARLRDAEGRPYRFGRMGSFGGPHPGHLVDGYQLIDADGDKLVLFFDMYHDDITANQQPAPLGMQFGE